MNKSDISQYVSGKVSPTQDKLYALGEALNVDPVWLMGADVPINRSGSEKITVEITDEEMELIEVYRAADPVFQKEAIDMLQRHPKQ
jgi:repressor LexA